MTFVRRAKARASVASAGRQFAVGLVADDPRENAFMPAARLMGIGAACLSGFALVILWTSLARAEGERTAGRQVAQAAAPHAVGSDCVTRKTAYRTKTTSDSTTSTSFVRLPGAVVRFTQGGSVPGCVIVQFSGVAETAHTMVIRARIGNTIATPDLIVFTRGDAGSGAHAFNFVFPRIRPGERAAIVEWHGFYGTATNMHQRTLIVQHR